MNHWLDKAIILLQAETSDLRELARIAGADPRTFYKNIAISDLDIVGQNLDGMQFASTSAPSALDTSDDKLGLLVAVSPDDSLLVEIDTIIKAIKKVARQEERLALVLKLVLQHRDMGYEIIKAYGRDTARFANSALATLADIVSRESAQMRLFRNVPNSYVSEDILAHNVYRHFGKGTPDGRFILLYFLARHLGHIRKINSYIRTRIDRSSSVFLDPYRGTIEEYLDYPPDTSWLELISNR